MAPKKPLLTLAEAAPERPVIDVFGSLHELRAGTELSPKEFAEITRITKAVEKIDEDESNPKNLALLIKYLDRIITMAIADTTPLSDEQMEKLTVDQKVQVVTTFTEHCLAGDVSQTPGNRAQRRARTTKKSTGAK